MIQWEWEENSVLYKTSPYTPPREIFQAVCNELGRYFAQSGAKYTKSSRKIKRTLGTVRLETAFWSSHGNTAGEWVNLEIVTTIYAVDKSEMEQNGLLYFKIKPKNFNVYDLDIKRFSEIIDYISGIAEAVKAFGTRRGIRQFLSGISQTEQQFLNEHSNNRIFFDRLSEEQDTGSVI